MTQPRPVRTRQQWMWFAVILVVGFVIWATMHDKQDPPRALTSSPATDQAAPVATPVPQAELSAADAAKQHDKGWVMEDFRLSADGPGRIDGTARIKNANTATSSAFFTVTLLLNGQRSLATWHGSADQVEPGATVTVTMLTQDPRPPNVTGHFAFRFQTDTSAATG